MNVSKSLKARIYFKNFKLLNFGVNFFFHVVVVAVVDDEVQDEEPTSAFLRDEIEELKKEIDQINYEFTKEEETPKFPVREEKDEHLSEEQKNKKKVSRRIVMLP